MSEEMEKEQKQVVVHGASSGPVYSIGMIGAWVYYFRGVTTFQEGVKAFLKGLAWPAFLVYDLLMFLNRE